MPKVALSILLVEDSSFQQFAVSILLKQLGHTVTIASDGFEALSAVQQGTCFDVILMDCQMPLMDGFEATRLIKDLARLNDKKMTVIGFSAAASPEQCYAAGMDDFMRKPLNKQILQAILSRWTRQKTSVSSSRPKSPAISYGFDLDLARTMSS